MHGTDMNEGHRGHRGRVTNAATLRVVPVSLQDIVTRHLTEKNAAEDHLPPLSPVAWAADSQSELTPSESLASSDAVRNTLLLPSVPFSHISNFLPALESIAPLPALLELCFLSSVSLVPLLGHLSSSPTVSPLIRLCFPFFFSFFNVGTPVHCLWM